MHLVAFEGQQVGPTNGVLLSGEVLANTATKGKATGRTGPAMRQDVRDEVVTSVMRDVPTSSAAGRLPANPRVEEGLLKPIFGRVLVLARLETMRMIICAKVASPPSSARRRTAKAVGVVPTIADVSVPVTV